MAYEGLKLSARFKDSKSAAPALAKTTPAAAAVISTPVSSSAKFTQADMDRAVASAVAVNTWLERDRIASVFANEASYGRERGCVTLLTSPKNFSTASINANLADMPRDQPRANVSTAHRVTKSAMGGSGKTLTPAEQAAASAVWDQVYASVSGSASASTSAPTKAGKLSASDAWDQAHAKVFGTASASTPAPSKDGKPSSEEVWAQAHANVFDNRT